MAIDSTLGGLRSLAITTARAFGWCSCCLTIFGAVTLANAVPSSVNQADSVPGILSDAVPEATPLASEFEQDVKPQLGVPLDVVAGYVVRLMAVLDRPAWLP